MDSSVRFPKTSATPLFTNGSGSSNAFTNAGAMACCESLSCRIMSWRSFASAVRRRSTNSATTIGLAGTRVLGVIDGTGGSSSGSEREDGSTGKGAG